MIKFILTIVLSVLCVYVWMQGGDYLRTEFPRLTFLACVGLMSSLIFTVFGISFRGKPRTVKARRRL